MRKRLYEIVEQSTENDKASKVYDIFMMVVIFISLVPLAFKKDYNALLIIDKVAAGIFIVDYIIRWLTADMKMKKGKLSLVLYPFSMMAIIDLISILPSITVLNGARI